MPHINKHHRIHLSFPPLPSNITQGIIGEINWAFWFPSQCNKPWKKFPFYDQRCTACFFNRFCPLTHQLCVHSLCERNKRQMDPVVASFTASTDTVEGEICFTEVTPPGGEEQTLVTANRVIHHHRHVLLLEDGEHAGSSHRPPLEHSYAQIHETLKITWGSSHITQGLAKVVTALRPFHI